MKNGAWFLILTNERVDSLKFENFLTYLNSWLKGNDSFNYQKKFSRIRQLINT